MSRVLEPEIMDDPEEVASYDDAEARRHLDRVDADFVAFVLAQGVAKGRALDVGAGPAAIPVKLLAQAPELSVVALDRGGPMLSRAAAARRTAGLAGRLELVNADGRALPFAPATFDLVISNSVMHHLADPKPVLAEMRRVLKPGGVLVVGDLRRPQMLAWPHLLWHGRHYRGLMWRLFRDSVRASFTVHEMNEVVRALGWKDADVIARTGAHLAVVLRAS